jgi:hypothetical protein
MANAVAPKKNYGKPGDVVVGRCPRTGALWTAVVGPSGKLIGKTYQR